MDWEMEKKNQKKASVLSKDGTSILTLKKKNPTAHKHKKQLNFLKLLAKRIIYKQFLIKQKKYGILITTE